MIKHYFTVAFRNLWKYKSQTLISVIGLAVGFTCFALAMLWIRYEMTYDDFHKNADRIYCVSTPDSFTPNGISRTGPYPLAAYLKETFPEINKATVLKSVPSKMNIKGVEHPVDIIKTDSSFLSFFDIKIIEGNMDFLIPDSQKTAITQEKARQLFGAENPLGKKDEFDYTICAVVSGFPKRSNYPFDFIKRIYTDGHWNRSSGEHTLVELVPNIDVEAFKKKLYKHEIKQENIFTISKITIDPLTTIRYEDENLEREVKFQHIIFFAIAGSLLILCTLFNYLTLFISRFRIRQREFALRTVFGSSGRSLFALLSIEFIMSLIIALLLGLFFIHILLPPFRILSGVRLELSSVYLESLVYITAVILISLLTFLLALAIFRRRNLNAAIRKGNKNLPRKISIIVQLIISIVFAFCTTVILKQMYYLHTTDLGFAFKNRGSVSIFWGKDINVLHDKIKQIPEITETLNGFYPLLPLPGRGSYGFSEWDDKPEDADWINIECIHVSEQYAAYYEFKLIDGEMLNDNDNKKFVLINESAAQAFGWKEPVGKSFGGYTVKGVVKNMYIFAPTNSARPVLFNYPDKDNGVTFYPSLLFKYSEGTWKSCKKKIEQIVKTEFPDIGHAEIFNTEEEYDKFLKSENTLLKILTSISLVCIIICIFGFVSLVSLTCEERRKEIAIRKINGATIKDILDIFFKEYITLLIVGAAIAFPFGYLIMKRWLEDYVVQTPIDAWIYVAILLALIMSIILCVGWKVYKTSKENPAEVVKS
ncbi:MAG: ABC transporter permease [Prevotellaceae bacterium]|jgi:ABC-type antimicrobial peptide transport system permease subunit|nr:ABC transporter permease [Prevotellaceae bacterium]